MASKVDNDWKDVEEDDWKDVEPEHPVSKNYEPSTFSEGVYNSLTNGEALGAGLKGLEGFAKGATLDIPSSIFGGIKSVGHAMAHPIDTISNLPSNIADFGKNVSDITSHAGSDPEQFGRMMGQVTGQPLVTAGITKGAPMLKSPIGSALEGTGNVMAKYQPLSGFLPRMADIRTLRLIEKLSGQQISKLGSYLKSNPKLAETLTPEHVNQVVGEIVEPEYTDVTPNNTDTRLATRTKGIESVANRLRLKR